MLQAGQLNKGGTRVTFKTNGSATGMNSNPSYMKAWAEAANEMKEQGKSEVLDGLWPQIDSQDVISKHSPAKIKSDTKKAGEKETIVEEEKDWNTYTPEKTGAEQEKRFSLKSYLC
jgi:hypothetical protein